MNKVLIVAALVLASCTPQTTCTTHSNQCCEVDTLTTQDTTTITLEWTPLFPVPITRVTRVNGGEYKWEVESENGVVFYSNKKYKVGDVAFYIDSETEKLYWTKK